MSVDEQFNTAADQVKNLQARPSDEELLDVYGLFKQATVADVNADRPGILDVKGRAKWDAWKSLNGMSQHDAKQKYVELVNRLVSKYGL